MISKCIFVFIFGLLQIISPSSHATQGNEDLVSERVGFLNGLYPSLVLIVQGMQSAQSILEKNRAFQETQSFMMFYRSNYSSEALRRFSQSVANLIEPSFKRVLALDRESFAARFRGKKDPQFKKAKIELERYLQNEAVNPSFDSTLKTLEKLLSGVDQEIRDPRSVDLNSKSYREAYSASLKFSYFFMGSLLHLKEVFINGDLSLESQRLSLQMMRQDLIRIHVILENLVGPHLEQLKLLQDYEIDLEKLINQIDELQKNRRFFSFGGDESKIQSLREKYKSIERVYIDQFQALQKSTQPDMSGKNQFRLCSKSLLIL